MELDGLRAIIIGGASGFARATATRIAAGGGTVAILDREQSAGADVAAELGGSWHPCDVMDFEGIEVVIEEAVAALGGLDFALNTAGGGKAGRTVGRDGSVLPRRLPPHHRPQPGRHLQHDPPLRLAHEQERAERRGRAWRADQHGVSENAAIEHR